MSTDGHEGVQMCVLLTGTDREVDSMNVLVGRMLGTRQSS